MGRKLERARKMGVPPEVEPRNARFSAMADADGEDGPTTRPATTAPATRAAGEQ